MCFPTFVVSLTGPFSDLATGKGWLEIRGDALLFPIPVTRGFGAVAAAHFLRPLWDALALAPALFGLGQGAARFGWKRSFFCSLFWGHGRSYINMWRGFLQGGR